MSGQITLITINNPFDASDCKREQINLTGSLRVVDLLGPTAHEDAAVSLNGVVLESEHDLQQLVKADDYLIVCPIPERGGGKNILRIAALIAVSVLSAGAAAAFFAGSSILIGSTAAAIGQGIMAGALTVAGSMAVNALIPVEPAVQATNQNIEDNSPSYGVDGAKNTQSEGVKVPVIYGTFRVAGNIVGLSTRNIKTDDDTETQEIDMVIALSEGPIAGVSDIRINDQPLANYADSVRTTFTRGINSGIILGGLAKALFPSVVTPINVNREISTAWQTFQTNNACDQLRIDLVAPQGWRRIDNDGNSQPIKEILEIQYRQVGSATWVPMPSDGVVTGTEYRYVYWKDSLGSDLPQEVTYTTQQHGILNQSTNAIRVQKLGGRRKDVEAEDRFITVGKRITIDITSSTLHAMSGKYTSAHRQSIFSPRLAQAQYEVRVRRQNPEDPDDRVIDTIYWADLNEIQNDKLAYVNTAMLSVKVTLGDQISGLPSVTALVEGRELLVYEPNTTGQLVATTEHTANPAWVALDIMTNSRYAGRIPISQIDLEQWSDWAEFCDDNGLEFNGVFDTDSNVWDALQPVLRCGRARLINVGRKYSVAIEKPAKPTMMFNVGNIVERSLNIEWLPLADRANEIEVTYYDKENDYKATVLRVVDTQAQQSAERRVQELNLVGVVHQSQALSDARFYLNINRLMTQTVSFSAPIESIACTIGDVILVQHDIPQWAFGGRLEAGSTTTQLVLDKPVTIEAGKTYKVLVHHDVAPVGIGTVQSIAGGRYLTLSGLISSQWQPTHITIQGVDYNILRSGQQNNKTVLTLEQNAPSSVAGKEYIVWQMDLIEEQTVTNGPGTYTTINRNSLFAPPAYAKWMFGEVNKQKKPFRIIRISGDTDDLTRQITAVEYDDQAYSDTTVSYTPPVYSSLPTVAHVTNLSVTQIQKSVAGVSTPILRLEWSKGSENYAGADIFARLQDEDWRQVGTVRNGERVFEYSDIAPDTVVVVRVVAVDTLGSRAPFKNAPTSTTAIGNGAPLLAPNTLALTTTKTAVELRWSAAKPKFYRGAEIAYTTTSAFSSPVTLGTFTDLVAADTVTYGTKRWYWIRQLNSDNTPGVWSTTGVTAGVPANPSGLGLASPFNGPEFTVTWADQPDAARYEVTILENTTVRRVEAVTTNRFTYTKANAAADGATGRTFIVRVKAINICGVKSTGQVEMTVTNAAPPAPNNIVVNAGYETVTVNFDAPDIPDLDTIKVWLSTTNNFSPSNANLRASLRGGPITITGLTPDTNYYVRLATYDTWGPGTTSGQYTIKTATVPIPSLSDWATRVDPVDQAFIDAHMNDESITSTKIANLTVGKLTSGTINALVGIASTGVIYHQNAGYKVSLGPQSISGSTHGMALFSFTANGSPKVAFYEDGTAVFNGQVIIQPGSTGYAGIADKPTALSQISSTEGTKLAGIEAGATVGAVWGSNISGQPSNDDLLNYFESAAATMPTLIASPAGAAHKISGAVTGAWAIKLPSGFLNTMVRFSIEIYNYSATDSLSSRIEVGGYLRATGSTWINTYARSVGSAAQTVRFGVLDGLPAVFVGETTTAWSNASIRVSNFMASHSNKEAGRWKSGWTVSMVTTLGTIQATVTDTLTVASNSLKIGGVDAAAVLQDIATTQDALDGKITAFYQPTAPTTGMSLGDIWYDTDDQNLMYVWNGTQWLLGQNKRISELFQQTQTAQTTADKKAEVFFASTAPTAATEGDIWYKTTTSELFSKQANGTWLLVSTVGASWGSTLTGIPTRFTDTATPGLNLTATHMGYYSSGWRSYMNDQGHFYLNASGSDNYLAWNGNTLTVRGNIEASSVKANVSLSAPVISGGTITSTTLNSAVIRTNDIEVRNPGGQLILSSGGGVPWTGISGAVPADRVSFARSGNMLRNTEFPDRSVTGWTQGWNPNSASIGFLGTEKARANNDANNTTYVPKIGDALVIVQSGMLSSGTASGPGGLVCCDLYPNGTWNISSSIAVTAGDKYEFSVIGGSHRCSFQVMIAWYDASGAYLGENSVHVTNGWTPQTALPARQGVIATAPAGAIRAEPIIRKFNTTSGADSYTWIYQPYFGMAGPAQTVLSPYSPGTRKGAFGDLSKLDPYNSPTFIANGAFDTLQLRGNAVTVQSVASYSGNTIGAYANNLDTWGVEMLGIDYDHGYNPGEKSNILTVVIQAAVRAQNVQLSDGGGNYYSGGIYYLMVDSTLIDCAVTPLQQVPVPGGGGDTYIMLYGTINLGPGVRRISLRGAPSSPTTSPSPGIHVYNSSSTRAFLYNRALLTVGTAKR